MRFLVKVTLPIDEGNEAIRDGSIMEKLQRIVEDAQPEAMYFTIEEGQRTQYLVVNVDDVKDLPNLAEPWWLLFSADVSVSPVFTLEDMKQMGPTMEEISRKWGQD